MQPSAMVLITQCAVEIRAVEILSIESDRKVPLYSGSPYLEAHMKSVFYIKKKITCRHKAWFLSDGKLSQDLSGVAYPRP